MPGDASWSVLHTEPGLCNCNGPHLCLWHSLGHSQLWLLQLILLKRPKPRYSVMMKRWRNSFARKAAELISQRHYWVGHCWWVVWGLFFFFNQRWNSSNCLFPARSWVSLVLCSARCKGRWHRELAVLVCSLAASCCSRAGRAQWLWGACFEWQSKVPGQPKLLQVVADPITKFWLLYLFVNVFMTFFYLSFSSGYGFVY